MHIPEFATEYTIAFGIITIGCRFHAGLALRLGRDCGGTGATCALTLASSRRPQNRELRGRWRLAHGAIYKFECLGAISIIVWSVSKRVHEFVLLSGRSVQVEGGRISVLSRPFRRCVCDQSRLKMTCVGLRAIGVCVCSDVQSFVVRV